MIWKGVKEENQMEICTEKCALMHCFMCIPYGMKTVKLVQKVLNEKALEWKSVAGLNRPEGSITDLLKWFSHINLFIFWAKALQSGFRCQMSGVRNELADT